jgi:birA, biotin-[acetyl-CoA-carboxylase] ligase region
MAMDTIPIRNPFPGASCFLIASTDSTQEDARRLAAQGFPVGSLVAADEQSSGRGRLAGRTWSSQPGANLLFTIYLAPELARLPGLPIRIGASLGAAVFKYAREQGLAFPSPPLIKWPNDLLLGGRKAAGLMCEASAEGVFAGVGLNCNQLSFPPELAKRATSLAIELKREVNRWAILELFLDTLAHALDDPHWREAVLAHLWKLGQEVSFREGRGEAPPFRGRLAGLDESGALVLVGPDGSERAFSSGELPYD